MNDQIVLGIDAGGTRTSAILVDRDGRVLGEGSAGPGNYHNVGLDQALRNIAAAADDAWKNAGMLARAADAAFIGAAGLKSHADHIRLRTSAEAARLAPCGAITVANDLQNALAGGLEGRPGVALIAGTGSHCLGRDAHGSEIYCGGWGWLLDDAGGGLWLALTAMRAVARATDGRNPATSLSDAVLAFLGLSEPEELLEKLYVKKPPADELARLAPIVTRHASHGDAVALQILQEGAAALAELVQTCASRLDFSTAPEVVLLGGCAQSGAPYQPLIESAVQAACPGARIVEAAMSPGRGAALNALRMAGVAPLPKLEPS